MIPTEKYSPAFAAFTDHGCLIEALGANSLLARLARSQTHWLREMLLFAAR